MSWLRNFPVFLPYAVIPTKSLAVGRLTGNIPVDHAFTESIIELRKVGPVEYVGSKLSHYLVST